MAGRLDVAERLVGMPERGLTPRQRAFVNEYLIDLNATAAAIRAGYSRKTARSIGQENLTKPDIVAAITRAQEKRTKRTDLTADLVIRRLREEADDRSKGSSHSARVAALKLLGQHLGLFPKQVTHTGRVGVDIDAGRDLARRALAGDREANLADRLLDELAGGGNQPACAGDVCKPGPVPPSPPPETSEPKAS